MIGIKKDQLISAFLGSGGYLYGDVLGIRRFRTPHIERGLRVKNLFSTIEATLPWAQWRALTTEARKDEDIRGKRAGLMLTVGEAPRQVTVRYYPYVVRPGSDNPIQTAWMSVDGNYVHPSFLEEGTLGTQISSVHADAKGIALLGNIRINGRDFPGMRIDRVGRDGAVLRVMSNVIEIPQTSIRSTRDRSHQLSF